MVAAILGLGDESFKLDLIQLSTSKSYSILAFGFINVHCAHLNFHMYMLQDCSKSHGDEIQRFLLAAHWCLLHSHLDEEPEQCLPPSQGKAWEGINAAGSPHETNPPPASGKE